MEQRAGFSLTAFGKTGVFTVEVLNGPEDRWFLSVDSPRWCFDFELIGSTMVTELAAFLRFHSGAAQFAELVIGSFGGFAVRIVKDNEFADRFFLRAAGGGSLIEFTLVGAEAEEFASAVITAAEEFGAST